MFMFVNCWRCGTLTSLTDELCCRRCNLDLSDSSEVIARIRNQNKEPLIEKNENNEP